MFFAGLDNGPGELVKWFFYYGKSSAPIPTPAPCVGFSINDGGHAYWLAPTLYTPVGTAKQ
jgi:hypothetical protein